ncbi:hypothetical protein [Kushneria phosphatilytica]|uniref:Uncharacterized protein n=1 Tax=Kushneria phosphatilytica TaxID=657387 RepID=A0A1S1NVJ0_9GAMM|nr:hypothetical protein [Kushneria phosphatilytica]OHV10917.1 hypothetical protein BH688_08495 [Kushneria phosphatilytica]QEL11997.1 hypothetical protein FY550_13175 [Kushneria phosphatilytica]
MARAPAGSLIVGDAGITAQLDNQRIGSIKITILSGKMPFHQGILSKMGNKAVDITTRPFG